MKALTNSIIFLLLVMFLTSCSSDFYMPDQGNLLVLQEKKDLKASLAYNHLQAAYSPINNLGLKANGTFQFNNPSDDQGKRSLYMGTLGVGWYTSKKVEPASLKEKKKARHPQPCYVGFDIYANVSLGTMSTANRSTPRSLIFPGPGSVTDSSIRIFESNIFRPYIGTHVYWQSRKYTINFAVNVGAIYYYNTKGFGSYNKYDFALATDLAEKSPFFLTEYDLQIAKGNDRLQTFMQATWNNNFSDFLSPKGSFSFGLKFNIPSFLESLKKVKE